MARIGILTCTNCTQDSNCASVCCLADMRKRRGFFKQYPDTEPLDLVGIINCAGCPTLAAPQKVLRRVDALIDFKIDVLHLSYCMTAVCPFIQSYQKVIQEKYPNLKIVLGTHQPADRNEFQRGVRELLCQNVRQPQTMTSLIRGTTEMIDGPLKF